MEFGNETRHGVYFGLEYFGAAAGSDFGGALCVRDLVDDSKEGKTHGGLGWWFGKCGW